MLSLQRLKALIKKEFIQLKRDRPTLAMIIMLPIMQLMLFGYAINMDPKHLPLAVISNDNTFLSRSVISSLKNSEYFEVKKEISSDNEGETLLKRGDVFFVLSIPSNFTKDVIRGEKPNLLLEADASDPSTIVTSISAIKGIVENIITSEFKGPLATLKNSAPAFDIMVQKSYNPEGLTKYNIVPGLIGMVLVFTGVMMTALALTRERERGTMENLLSMPIKPLEVMIGKITPFVFIGFFQISLILILSRFLFEIPIMGSLPLLFFCAFVFIICNLAIGFLISTAAKNQTQALQMSIFVLLPSMLITGFMFPFYGMPKWAQILGSCFPLTYFIKIVRGIMLKGSEFADILPNLYPMLIIMLAITLLTLKAYKNTLD